MSAIGPGDFVECVNVAPMAIKGWGMSPPARDLTLGAIYRVKALDHDRKWDLFGVHLDGVVSTNPGFIAFRVERFKPVYRPKQSLIRDLLQPISEDA